jgi:hypothetical protein
MPIRVPSCGEVSRRGAVGARVRRGFSGHFRTSRSGISGGRRAVDGHGCGWIALSLSGVCRCGGHPPPVTTWCRLMSALQHPDYCKNIARRPHPSTIGRRMDCDVTCSGTEGLEWWLGPESNRGHEDFQSSALPTELPSLGHSLGGWTRPGSAGGVFIASPPHPSNRKKRRPFSSSCRPILSRRGVRGENGGRDFFLEAAGWEMSRNRGNPSIHSDTGDGTRTHTSLS